VVKKKENMKKKQQQPKQKVPEKKQLDLLDLSKESFDLAHHWPYENSSVKEINCFHKLEYIPGRDRVAVIEEAWRVLEVGGKLNIIVCYWTSPRSIQDPTMEWPPLCEQSFLYFNKGWREANQQPPIKADFDFTYGYQVDPEIAGKATEAQTYCIKHYVNSVLDLQLALIKKPATS
jgi:hypothetical protein